MKKRVHKTVCFFTSSQPREALQVGTHNLLKKFRFFSTAATLFVKKLVRLKKSRIGSNTQVKTSELKIFSIHSRIKDTKHAKLGSSGAESCAILCQSNLDLKSFYLQCSQFFLSFVLSKDEGSHLSSVYVEKSRKKQTL